MKQPVKNDTPKTASKKTLPGQPVTTPPQTDSGLLELFTDGIKEMYWAENHLVKSLPKMISAAGEVTLKNGLSTHLEQTAEHATRLENVLENLGEKIEAKKCDACEGLVMSGEHVIEATDTGSEARDTGIILSALKVENFEITTYTGLIQLATKLGLQDAADLLNQNLADEVETEAQLTAMSTGDAAPSKKATTKN